MCTQERSRRRPRPRACEVCKLVFPSRPYLKYVIPVNVHPSAVIGKLGLKMPRQITGLKGHMKHRRNLCIVCGLSATAGKSGGRFTETLQKIFVENVTGGEYYDKDDLSLPDGCCSSCRHKIHDGRPLPELFIWPFHSFEEDFPGVCECFLCDRSRNRHKLTLAAKSEKKKPERKQTSKQTYYGF